MTIQEFSKMIHQEYQKFESGTTYYKLEEKARINCQALAWEAFLAGWLAAGGPNPWHPGEDAEKGGKAAE